MKKFNFSLKALLSYREHMEQIAMQDLAKAQADVNQVMTLIDELNEEFSKTRDELQAESEKGISSVSMGMYLDYLNGLEQRIYEARDALARLRIIADRRRAILHEKSVEKKIITNLKDKRKKDYVDEALKAAQNESDEMVLLSGVFGKKTQQPQSGGDVK